MADYSGLEKVLHRLALGVGPIAELVHDIERGRFLKSAPPAQDARHVIVTGLARAGSTVLMREIYATGAFASLTYADMPFVLAPNLWAGLSRSKSAGKRGERAHGDGIEIDTDSPEALEEVYWRVCCGADYISGAGLTPHIPTQEAMDGYIDFIRLILRRYSKARYLAKNNNSILRLGSLAQAMPQSEFLVPMRAPLQHAQSLLGQHRRFLTSDKFTKDYMTWLAHHEFGATQRPFLMGSAPTGDPLDLNYWLHLWIDVYSELGSIVASTPNAIFVSHQDLMGHPDVWPAICHRLKIKAGPLTEIRQSDDRKVEAHDPELADRATAIYDALRSAALPRLLAA